MLILDKTRINILGYSLTQFVDSLTHFVDSVSHFVDVDQHNLKSGNQKVDIDQNVDSGLV